MVDGLSKLATDSTGNSQGRVNVGKEASWVGLDLLDAESCTSVNTVGHDTSLVRCHQTPARVAHCSIASWVGEGQTWRPRGTLDSFVEVCGGKCGRGVVASKVDELDVKADEVKLGVDSKVVVADCTLQTASGGCAVDDLVRSSNDVVGGSELEGSVCALPLALARVVNVLPASRRSGVTGEVLASSLGVGDLGEVHAGDIDLRVVGRSSADREGEERNGAGDGGGLHIVGGW